MSSGQNISFPNTALNAAMADSLDSVATELEAATAKGEELNKAVGKLLTKIIKEHKRIIFNGNNYAPEWEKEAGKRKLLNLKNTVDALPQLITQGRRSSCSTSTRSSTSARCTRATRSSSRTTTRPSTSKANLMVLMANRYILPAALEYQKNVGQSVAAVEGRRRIERPGQEAARDATRSWSIGSRRRPTRSQSLLDHSDGSAEKHAKYMRDKVMPAMAKLRELGDQIEVLTPHEIWPLPTYREMLFVK